MCAHVHTHTRTETFAIAIHASHWRFFGVAKVQAPQPFRPLILHTPHRQLAATPDRWRPPADIKTRAALKNLVVHKGSDWGVGTIPPLPASLSRPPVPPRR